MFILVTLLWLVKYLTQDGSANIDWNWLCPCVTSPFGPDCHLAMLLGKM